MASCTCIFLCVYNIDLYSKYSKLKKGQKPSSNITQDDGNKTRCDSSHTPVKKVGSLKDRSNVGPCTFQCIYDFSIEYQSVTSYRPF